MSQLSAGEANHQAATFKRSYGFDPGKPDWLEKAKCRGIQKTNPVMYAKAWPPNDMPAATQEMHRKHFKQVYCLKCPVAEACLTYGETSGSSGVWGGQDLRTDCG